MSEGKSPGFMLPFAGAIAIGALGFGAGWMFGTSGQEIPVAERADMSQTAVGAQAAPDPATAERTGPAISPKRSGTKGGPLTKEELLSSVEGLNVYGGMGPSKLRKMLDFQERLQHQDVRALIQQLIGNKTPEGTTALTIAMGVYAEQDARGALDFMLNLPDKDAQSVNSYQVISLMMESDPDGTLARLKAIENPQRRRQALGTAQSALASKDPSKAFEMYLANSGSETEMNAYSIFSQWGRKDPGAATAALGRIKDTRQWQQAASALGQQWAQTDPRAAWQWASGLTSIGEQYQDPRGSVISAWATTDPAAAIAAADQIAEADVRTRVLSQAVSSWMQRSPREALAWAVAIPDSASRADVLQQFSHQDSVDPSEVLEAYLEYMPSGDRFRNGISSLMSRWARKDPGAAAAALSRLPGDMASSAIGSISSQWVQRDPAAAGRWLRSLPESDNRSSAWNNYFTELAKTNPQGAQQELDAIPEKDYRSSLNGFVNGWAGKDPAAAANWVLGIAEDDMRGNAVNTIVQRWGNSNPAKAAEWVLRLPEKEKANAMANLVEQWTQRDLESAAEWLNRVPANATRDESVSRLANKLVREDPEGATAWAQAITNQDRRNEVTEQIARNWMRSDASAARAWIQRSNLPEDRKNRLLGK